MDFLQQKLLKAIKQGDTKSARQALEKGADVEYRYSEAEINTVDELSSLHNVTPLYLAIDWEKQELIDLLVSRKADTLSLVMGGKDTPLHSAIRTYLPLGTISTMLPEGTSHEVPLGNGDYPIDVALRFDNIHALSAILAAGSSPNCYNNDNDPPLFALNDSIVADSQMQRKIILAKMMLAAGADMRLKNRAGQSVLDRVDGKLSPVYKAHYEEVKQMLACEAGDGIPDFALVDSGKPTAQLLQISGAGLLSELFSPARWQGKEPERAALYEQVSAALPDYYRDRLAAEVVVTPLPGTKSMRIYLVRHGQSDANVDQTIRRTTPDPDIDLAALGHVQAMKTGDWLKQRISNDVPTAQRKVKLYHSPYLRARKTAERIINAMGMGDKGGLISGIEANPLLKEIVPGIFAGYSFEERAQLFPTEYEAFSRAYAEGRGFNAVRPGGESLENVAARMDEFIPQLHNDVKDGVTDCVIVGHEQAHQVLVKQLTGMSAEEFEKSAPPYKNGQVRMLELDTDGKVTDHGFVFTPEHRSVTVSTPKASSRG